jgi:hypothetical protein
MRLLPAFFISVPAALLCACSAPQPDAPGQLQGQFSGSSTATVFEKRTFKLVKTPDPDLEAALEGLLSSGYDAAVSKHAGDNPMDIGFTYSLAPKGAVYPFSEIEVSCILQERYAARSGVKLCGDFFSELDARIKQAVSGKQ